jgi:hypothetical protein
MMLGEDELRFQFEKWRGARVPQGAWEHLVDYGEVDEVLREAADFTYLERRLRLFIERAANRGEPARREVHLPPDQRLEVLARLVADEVTADPWVSDFRARVLFGNLLTLGEASAWVIGQHDRDAEVNWHTQVAEFPAIGVPETADGSWGADPHARVQVPKSNFLEYVQVMGWTNDDGSIVPIPSSIDTPIGGVLDELRRQTERLAGLTTWTPRDVCTFILTGIVPPMPKVSGELVQRRYGDLDVSYIEFKVRPSVAAPEVAAAYREIRRRWLTPEVPQRVRRAKRPLAALVEFVDARPSMRWEDRMREWNSTYPNRPDYQFKFAANMQRDYAGAVSRAAGRRPRA